MRSFIITVIVSGLLACSPAGQDSCAKGPGQCEEDCSAPGGRCVDGGGSDAPSGAATLSALSVAPGMLSPAFAPATTLYTVQVSEGVDAVQVTAQASAADATLQISGAPVSVGTASSLIPLSGTITTVMVTVHGRGAAAQIYSVVVMRRGSPDYLKASNTTEQHSFGGHVALAGDTLAVAAPFEDSKATGVGGDQQAKGAIYSGAVYVFRRTKTDWVQEAYIKASNTGGSDTFGNGLALSGDTLAVGAAGEDSKAAGVGGDQADNSAQDSGAVYVFQRTGSTWTQQAYLKASNPGPLDNFGSVLSLSGDTLAVGAAGEDSKARGVGGDQTDNSAVDSGAVYVFQRTGTSWAQQAYLKAANTDAGDAFGTRLALSGDTLAVGAVGEGSKAVGVNGDQLDNSAYGSGAVYVFQRTGASWAQQAYLKASNTDANDAFGYDVTLAGDTLAVGANLESSNAAGINGDQADNSAKYSGAVYVFQRTGTSWVQQAYLKAANPDPNDRFGRGLCLSGDTLAVGAYLESSKATGVGGDQTDNSAKESGAVYVFQRTDSSWAQRAYLKASNTDAGDWFGIDVALSGDTLAVGASRESSKARGVNGDQADNSAGASGAVYVFRKMF